MQVHLVGVLVAVIVVQNWNDEYLVWKPEDYGGIHHISIPPSSIWTPDIELYNRHETLHVLIASLK